MKFLFTSHQRNTHTACPPQTWWLCNWKCKPGVGVQGPVIKLLGDGGYPLLRMKYIGVLLSHIDSDQMTKPSYLMLIRQNIANTLFGTPNNTNTNTLFGTPNNKLFGLSKNTLFAREFTFHNTHTSVYIHIYLCPPIA